MMYLNLTLTAGTNLPLEDLVNWLESAGYTRMKELEDPKQFTVKGDVVDVWLPDGRGLRVEMDYDEIAWLRVFQDQEPQSLDSFVFPIANAPPKLYKGNISYHYTQLKKGEVRCYLRGAGTQRPEVKKYILARGFHWVRGNQYRNVNAWVANVSREEMVTTLRMLAKMGYTIKPAATLGQPLYLTL